MSRRSAWNSLLVTKLQPTLALTYLVYVLIGYGFQLASPAWALPVARYFGLGLSILQGVLLLLKPVPFGETFFSVQRKLAIEWGWLAGVLLTLPTLSLFALACSVAQLVVLARVATLSGWWSRAFPVLMARPAQTLAASFLLIITLGTLLLMLPKATVDGLGASWVDALFTSTSATCVTGLTVLNTAPDVVFNPAIGTFSRFGQTVILLLIQVGGLSIMTLSAALVIMAGKSLDLRSRAALGDLLDEGEGRLLETAVSFILRMTLALELAGALLLLVRFYGQAPSVGEAVYWSVFHSVSAFCNAGFGLFGDNLTRYATDPLVSLTISGLIIIGGLGYATVACLTFSVVFRDHLDNWRRWIVHARMAASMTLGLLFVGTVFTFYVEYDNSLAHLPLAGKLLASLLPVSDHSNCWVQYG